MAGKNSKSDAADRPQAVSPPLEEQPLADLARAILARQIRPRVGQIRRLAEAVLAREEKRLGKKKDKKRKLAKIPRSKVKS